MCPSAIFVAKTLQVDMLHFPVSALSDFWTSAISIKAVVFQELQRQGSCDALTEPRAVLQAQGLGVSLAKGMRHLLDSSAAATGGVDDASFAASATAQHTLGLHALSALVGADSSGSVATALGETGVLAAVLDSLGSGTLERLHAPAHLLQDSIALTAAHFRFLQV